MTHSNLYLHWGGVGENAGHILNHEVEHSGVIEGLLRCSSGTALAIRHPGSACSAHGLTTTASFGGWVTPLVLQQVQMLDLLLTRIRLTRDIPMYDHRLVEEACLSGEDPMACRMFDAGFKFPLDGGA